MVTNRQADKARFQEPIPWEDGKAPADESLGCFSPEAEAAELLAHDLPQGASGGLGLPGL